jgi:hypothetical protein
MPLSLGEANSINLFANEEDSSLVRPEGPDGQSSIRTPATDVMFLQVERMLPNNPYTRLRSTAATLL